jgi:cephalosporin-C deacetylase-like acetyl esterase
MSVDDLERQSPGDGFYDVRDQLKNHIYRRSERAFDAGDAARDAITTREGLEARQRALREQFVAMLGGLPPSDTPLEPQIVGTVEGTGYHIEKVVFQSRPHNYVTANLYLPDDLQVPRAAVQFLCGHSDQAKQYTEYQAVCQYLAQAGLIVLAQDPIGQGERFSYYEPTLKGPTVTWGTTEHDHAGIQCLPVGDTIGRYFLHDAMRGIDYLRSRPEVDKERIGVTGNSGGGTQSSLMMLADPRLAAAAPGTFIMNRRTYMWSGGAQDAEQIWPGFTAAGFDHEDILLAMAPKPVRVLAVTSDFFPIEGVRSTVARCKRLWALYGREDAIDLVEDFSGHAYTRPLARASAKFFAHHLLGRDIQPEAISVAPYEAHKLWCMSSGQVRGEIKEAVSVLEANQQRVAELERARQALPAAQRRERAVQWLREKVMKDRVPCDLNPRFYQQTRLEEMPVEIAFWWAQEGLHNHGYAFRNFTFGDQKLPVTLAIWDRGTNCLRPHLDWLRTTCESGRTVLVLNVSGMGALSPHSITATRPEALYGVYHKLADDLFWLDDDLAALRIYDVLRALDMIAQWPGMDASDIQVYAHGREGTYGRLAAALDDRIRKVEVVDGIARYADWATARHYDVENRKSIVLRGMLRYFDLPDLEAPGER